MHDSKASAGLTEIQCSRSAINHHPVVLSKALKLKGLTRNSRLNPPLGDRGLGSFPENLGIQGQTRGLQDPPQDAGAERVGVDPFRIGASKPQGLKVLAFEETIKRVPPNGISSAECSLNLLAFGRGLNQASIIISNEHQVQPNRRGPTHAFLANQTFRSHPRDR